MLLLFDIQTHAEIHCTKLNLTSMQKDHEKYDPMNFLPTRIKNYKINHNQHDENIWIKLKEPAAGEWYKALANFRYQSEVGQ